MARPQRAAGVEQRTSITPLLDALERVFGRGPTYPLKIQNAIMEGTPEFLFRGVRLADSAPLGQRCARALEYLDRPGRIPAEQRDEALSRLAELEREVALLTKQRIAAAMCGGKRG